MIPGAHRGSMPEERVCTEYVIRDKRERYLLCGICSQDHMDYRYFLATEEGTSSDQVPWLSCTETVVDGALCAPANGAQNGSRSGQPSAPPVAQTPVQRLTKSFVLAGSPKSHTLETPSTSQRKVVFPTRSGVPILSPVRSKLESNVQYNAEVAKVVADKRPENLDMLLDFEREPERPFARSNFFDQLADKENIAPGTISSQDSVNRAVPDEIPVGAVPPLSRSPGECSSPYANIETCAPLARYAEAEAVAAPSRSEPLSSAEFWELLHSRAARSNPVEYEDAMRLHPTTKSSGYRYVSDTRMKRIIDRRQQREKRLRELRTMKRNIEQRKQQRKTKKHKTTKNDGRSAPPAAASTTEMGQAAVYSSSTSASTSGRPSVDHLGEAEVDKGLPFALPSSESFRFHYPANCEDTLRCTESVAGATFPSLPEGLLLTSGTGDGDADGTGSVGGASSGDGQWSGCIQYFNHSRHFLSNP